MSRFDPARARLRGPDYFPRWTLAAGGHRPLREHDLPGHLELLIAERGGARVGFLVREIAHPHVVQGDLAGHPFLVSF